jgi:CheY-like chemotaxis protein
VYRILVVDDDPSFRDQMTKLIDAQLPGCVVVAAGDVDGALQILEEARRTDRPFSAGILDVMLPKVRGANAELDHLVEDEMSRSHGTLIIRITVFDDVKVRNYFAKTRQRLPPILPVSKTESGFSMRIVVALKRDRVARQIKEIFAPPTGRVKGRGSATLALASLMNDINLFWKDLDSDGRERIRDYFDIEERPEGGIRVSLGGRERSLQPC